MLSRVQKTKQRRSENPYWHRGFHKAFLHEKLLGSLWQKGVQVFLEGAQWALCCYSDSIPCPQADQCLGSESWRCRVGIAEYLEELKLCFICFTCKQGSLSLRTSMAAEGIGNTWQRFCKGVFAVVPALSWQETVKMAISSFWTLDQGMKITLWTQIGYDSGPSRWEVAGPSLYEWHYSFWISASMNK